MEDLIEGLQEKIVRCRRVLKEFEEMPFNIFDTSLLKATICKAERGIKNKNVIEMVSSYERLKEYE